MSTKSQWHRYHAVRSGPGKPKSRPKPRRDFPVDTAKPGVSASDRKAGIGSTAKMNLSARAARKAAYKLEDSASGKPSRRSTRKSRSGQKPAHAKRRAKLNLQRHRRGR